MSTATANRVAAEIKAHIDSRGGPHSSWYVGIATDPRDRLFSQHGVDEKNGNWVYRTLSTSAEAREIEDYFVNTLGTDGGPGGGDHDTKSVYAYRKTSGTKP